MDMEIEGFLIFTKFLAFTLLYQITTQSNKREYLIKNHFKGEKNNLNSMVVATASN